MAIIPTQQDYDMIQQSTRDLQVKIELLNFNFQIVGNIEGNVIDGTINIDANSDIRRTCDIQLIVTDSSFNISEGNKIWLDKFIRVKIGYTDIITKELKFWNLGVFMINNPDKVYNATTNTVSFQGLDLMAKLTKKRDGQLTAITTLIPANTTVKEAIIGIITDLGGFRNYVIDDTDNTIPYDIKVSSDGCIYDILTTIRDLYSNWEMFFDVNGVFNFRKITDGANDGVVLDFTTLDKQLIISDTISIDFENVKNYIVVYGRMLDDGTQVKAEIGDYYPDSPYNITKLEKINYVITDERIYNDDLALERAVYELFLHARMNDGTVLEVPPIYWLNDANVCIRVKDVETGLTNKYLIKNISIPLGIGSNMVINAIKVYEDIVVPKPVVGLYPTTVDVPYGGSGYIRGEWALILDIYATDEFETFEITEDNLEWTFFDNLNLEDCLQFKRIIKISDNHIRVFYTNLYFNFDYDKTATLKIKNKTAVNIYGISNNETEAYNVVFKKALYSAIPSVSITTPTKLATVGDIFDMIIYLYSNWYSLSLIDVLDETSFLYDDTVLQINSASFVELEYSTYKITINCTALFSGTTELRLKSNIFKTEFDYYNIQSQIPTYITIKSENDFVVELNEQFIYNEENQTAVVVATTDENVDTFEITENDIEYDSFVMEYDYVTDVNNYTKQIYFKNFNISKFETQPVGTCAVRVKKGVAKKGMDISIASNYSICVGNALRLINKRKELIIYVKYIF